MKKNGDQTDMKLTWGIIGTGYLLTECIELMYLKIFKYIEKIRSRWSNCLN